MTWLEHARSRSVVLRAARTSALVGTLLVVINQGDVLVSAGIAAVSVSKLLLTYFVPYAVSTSSSVASRMESAASTGRVEPPAPVSRRPAIHEADGTPSHGSDRG